MGMPRPGDPTRAAGRKVLAGTFGGAMTFKPSPEDRAAALRVEGAEPFEPMKGRAMREWVLVPLAASGRWPELAERAWRHVAASD